MRNILKKVFAAMIALGLILVLTGLSENTAKAQKRTPVEIQILSVSDWHAQLDPLFGGVGGAAVLSAHWQGDRAVNPNTLTLTAGDAFGASPPLSSFFNEEPAVLSMNLMGFDADTLGNHNFDRGTGHLQQMIDIAEFQYVSANLANRDDNLTGVKDFEIFDVGGVKVAVIGVTNPEAPTLVFPGSFGTIEVTKPHVAANKARANARKAGAKVFILVAHMGVTGFDPDTGEALGPLIDLAGMVGNFDVILGDHTDFQYSGIHNNALVVQNESKGATYARTKLVLDPFNGRTISRDTEFVVPLASAVTPDPAIVALLQPYRDALGPILNTVVGDSKVEIPRADSCGNNIGRTCESLVGNVTTDSMRVTYGTDFAITNSGGLRADLTCPTIDIPTDFCPPFVPAPYPISRGQVLTVLPFGNVVVTLTVDGALLKTFLENGVSAMPAANGRFAQVSGLCFTYDIDAPAGSRVTGAVRQHADGSCTGLPVDLTAGSSYTLATNDFMAGGGDGYPVVIGQAVTRGLMDQDLSDHITASGTISPSIQGRVVCTTSGGTACPVTLP
ncbi:MAG: 5'-nucleotidase C-terminal domain-containing protein [Acidobacteriota bacterium]|nr:5'-nucleotidase C-terminal domain-containing protein [Acidobacteriota bacterium]